MRTKLRGVWMAANCATKEKFTVGWGFYPNNENVVALQNSCGCESLTDKNTAITQLSTLTTAPHVDETRMNSAFAGGGGI